MTEREIEALAAEAEQAETMAEPVDEYVPRASYYPPEEGYDPGDPKRNGPGGAW